jgi:hypothetical protein
MNKNQDLKTDEHYCKLCNKQYKTYKTLWEHNKKFHSSETPQNTSENPQISSKTPQSIQNLFICKYCNKSYSRKDNLKRHNINCKETNNETKQTELDLLVAKEKNLILKQEKEILKLKLKLEKSINPDNITLKQLNKKLLERQNLIKNSTIITDSNNNNKIQNNNIVNNNNIFQLVGFSKEEVVELLTMQEKKQIMNAKFCCLEKLVEIIHCGKYNQFKNIIITNMNNNYIYKYDDVKGQFVLSMKSSVLNSLMDSRISDIEIIYNELVENNKLDDKTKDMVERFINKINNDDSKFTDFDDKEYDSYKHYKINEVKLILYNNQDKITNDISLMLTTTNEPPQILNYFIK